MKILTILLLGLIITACSNTTDTGERLSREPIKYWNFEEQEKEFVKEEDKKTSDNIYYWNYDGEEE